MITYDDSVWDLAIVKHDDPPRQTTPEWEDQPDYDGLKKSTVPEVHELLRAANPNAVKLTRFPITAAHKDAYFHLNRGNWHPNLWKKGIPSCILARDGQDDDVPHFFECVVSGGNILQVSREKFNGHVKVHHIPSDVIPAREMSFDNDPTLITMESAIRYDGHIFGLKDCYGLHYNWASATPYFPLEKLILLPRMPMDVVITGSYLNVRAFPAANDDVVIMGELPRGTIVTLKQWVPRAGNLWALIEYNGGLAYIAVRHQYHPGQPWVKHHTDFIIDQDGAPAMPVIGVYPDLPVWVKVASWVWAGLRVRNAPTTNSDVIGSLAAGRWAWVSSYVFDDPYIWGRLGDNDEWICLERKTQIGAKLYYTSWKPL